MPIFMDTHEGTTDLPAELTKLVTERIQKGTRDEVGVMDRGIIIDRDGKKVHCILDAPDADAVMKHHELINVPLKHETIHRADAILR